MVETPEASLHQFEKVCFSPLHYYGIFGIFHSCAGRAWERTLPNPLIVSGNKGGVLGWDLFPEMPPETHVAVYRARYS